VPDDDKIGHLICLSETIVYDLVCNNAGVFDTARITEARTEIRARKDLETLLLRVDFDLGDFYLVTYWFNEFHIEDLDMSNIVMDMDK